MREFYIDPSRLITSNLDPITEACFISREILGAYMEEGLDLENYQEAIALENGSAAPTGEYDDDLVVHETRPVRINDQQSVYLSNIPYVCAARDEREPITEPGYVALRDTLDSDDPAYGPRDDAAQYIFRLPAPQSRGLVARAAIFEGWSMDAAHEITAIEKGKLNVVRNLLRVLRTGLRSQAMSDVSMYDEMYHSNVPRPSTDALFEEMLRNLPNGGQ